MSFVKVMIHAVWGTKSRQSFLNKEIRSVVFAHIKENAKIKEIYIDAINGIEDHIHMLFGLNADMSISKTLQLRESLHSGSINKIL